MLLLAGAALALATRPGSALAAVYVLCILGALAGSLPAALGRPRVGFWLARGLIGLATVMLLWGSRLERDPLVLMNPRNDFPHPAARLWHELAAPATWRGLGEPWVYVAAMGASPEELLAAGPVLAVDGQRLEVELDPWQPKWWLRARFPAKRLGQIVRLSFGFERPTPQLRVQLPWYLEGTLPRAPSSWSGDGAPPPPREEIPRRQIGFMGRLAGQSSYAAVLVRHGIELRLLESGSSTPTSPPRVIAGCY